MVQIVEDCAHLECALVVVTRMQLPAATEAKVPLAQRFSQ
jgi:hypothetical protein